jgi:uncharacterized protein
MLEIAPVARQARQTAPLYRARSWVDPRVEARCSPISGMGLFAAAPIAAGETVVIWGGRLFTRAEVLAGVPRERSLAKVDHGLYLGSLPEEPVTIDEYMNHACDPNVWLTNAVTLVARTPIAYGAELTVDYALWDTDADWSMVCNCRSPICRGVNTGGDWRRPDLRARYRGHFSPYVERMIARDATGGLR